MQHEIIAEIKLMPGQVGYYDEYSRIHLTTGNPTAYVYAGTNCAQLRRSIRSGRIALVSGSLGPHVPPIAVVEKDGRSYLVSNAKEEHKPVFLDKEEVVAAPVLEEVVEEPAPVEEPAEEAATLEEEVKEEVVEEETKEEETEDGELQTEEEETSEEESEEEVVKPKRGRAKKATSK